MMKYPKMILFDYGHTLLCEPGWDPVKGNAELLKYAVKNPNHCTIEDVKKGVEMVFGGYIDGIRKMGYDICGQVANRVLYESLGIELSLTPLEMETVFWNAASMGAVMPDADKMLDYLNENGIRSAVISNLLWSGEALTQRLNRLLPHHQFEFVMTSSDYLLRKPNRILFEIALQKQDFVQRKFGIAAIIQRRTLKGRHKLAFTPFGTTTTWKKAIEMALMKSLLSVNTCIFTNGMKCSTCCRS